jgi:hypothetical protein
MVRQIVIELENPGDSRTMFRLRISDIRPIELLPVMAITSLSLAIASSFTVYLTYAIRS